MPVLLLCDSMLPSSGASEALLLDHVVVTSRVETGSSAEPSEPPTEAVERLICGLV